MDTSLFILISDDHGQLEVDGRIDLFARLLSVLKGDHQGDCSEFLSSNEMNISPTKSLIPSKVSDE